MGKENLTIQKWVCFPIGYLIHVAHSAEAKGLLGIVIYLLIIACFPVFKGPTLTKAEKGFNWFTLGIGILGFLITTYTTLTISAIS